MIKDSDFGTAASSAAPIRCFLKGIKMKRFVSLVLALIIIVLSCASCGEERNVVMYTENFTVTDAMLSYYMYDYFNYLVSSYGYYFYYYYGFDYTASLKEQYYDSSSGATWYDYFLYLATDSATFYLTFCEAAIRAGLSYYDEKFDTLIDREIETLESTGESYGYSLDEYIKLCYGDITEDDVREALRLFYLAQEYYNYFIDGLDYSDEELEECFAENADDYTYVSYKVFDIEATYEDDADDETIDEAYAAAEAAANAIAKAEDSDEFDTLLSEYLTGHYADDDEMTDDDISSLVTAALIEDETIDKDEDYSVWLFDDDRELYDTTVIDDGEGTYTVYMVTSLAARQTYFTKNVRHILLSIENYDDEDACMEAAEAVLDEYISGGATEELFIELAAKYSYDTGSADTGGLYEDVMLDEMVEEFEDWCYDGSRTAGETGIVESDYGCHVMYFVGDGREAWAAQMYELLVEEAYEAEYDRVLDAYEVTSDLTSVNIVDINADS